MCGERWKSVKKIECHKKLSSSSKRSTLEEWMEPRAPQAGQVRSRGPSQKIQWKGKKKAGKQRVLCCLEAYSQDFKS